MNYAVTGELDQAASRLHSAARACDYTDAGRKLHERITRLQASVESCERVARRLIPGGWKPPNHSLSQGAADTSTAAPPT